MKYKERYISWGKMLVLLVSLICFEVADADEKTRSTDELGKILLGLILLGISGEIVKDKEHSESNQSRDYNQDELGSTKRKSLKRRRSVVSEYSRILVEKVQGKLYDEGYEVGQIDGLYGPMTRRAIINYQQDNGLNIDGKISQELMQHLGIYNEYVKALERNKRTTETPMYRKEGEMGAGEEYGSGHQQLEGIREGIAYITETTEMKRLPDAFSETIMELPTGAELYVVIKEGEWVKANVGDKVGYIFFAFIANK